MKKSRFIFYTVFGIFQLLMFLFTLYVDSNRDNIEFLIGMQRRLWLFKYASFLGLLLIVIDALWHLKEQRDRRKEHEQQALEMNKLKAKLFDMQEPPVRNVNPVPGSDQKI